MSAPATPRPFLETRNAVDLVVVAQPFVRTACRPTPFARLRGAWSCYDPRATLRRIRGSAAGRRALANETLVTRAQPPSALNRELSFCPCLLLRADVVPRPQLSHFDERRPFSSETAAAPPKSDRHLSVSLFCFFFCFPRSPLATPPSVPRCSIVRIQFFREMPTGYWFFDVAIENVSCTYFSKWSFRKLVWHPRARVLGERRVGKNTVNPYHLSLSVYCTDYNNRILYFFFIIIILRSARTATVAILKRLFIKFIVVSLSTYNLCTNASARAL